MADPLVETKNHTFQEKKMKKTTIARLLGIILVFVATFALAGPSFVSTAKAAEVCGNGSTPNYSFTYDLLQPHWTVGNGLVSEQAMTDVDAILDKLNADNIAQTMILVLPADQVGNRVNCAVHFLRYMQLGQKTGPHKDNGFTFVFVVEDGKIDVHYGVGLGLPALTAANLTPINRLAEETYKQTGSLDSALVETVKAFDIYARSQYAADPATPEPAVQTTTPESGGWKSVCLNIICLILLLAILIWAAKNGLLKNSGSSSPYASSGTRPSNPNNRGQGSTKPGSPTNGRGGSGSGKSGRGN